MKRVWSQTGAQLGGMFGRHAIPLYNTYQTKNKLKTIDRLMTRIACHPLLQYLSNQKQAKKNRPSYETTIFRQDQDKVEMKSCHVALLLLVLYCYVNNIHCYTVHLQFYCTKHSFLFISPMSWMQ